MRYIKIAIVAGVVVGFAVMWRGAYLLNDPGNAALVRLSQALQADVSAGIAARATQKPNDALLTYCRNAATTAQSFYQHWAMSPCAQPAEEDGHPARVLGDLAALGSWVEAIHREVRGLRRHIRAVVRSTCE